MDIHAIHYYCQKKKLRWTRHIFQRLIQRNISMADIESALMSGAIIEDYPDDYPDSSCLVLGFAVDNTPLHVVCGIHESELWLITAYRPDRSRWSSDFKIRKDT